MKEDSEIIFENIEIEGKLPVSFVTMGKSSDQTLEEYFSELDKDTIEKLYKKYKMDFLLFGYTIDDYYLYVNQS